MRSKRTLLVGIIAVIAAVLGVPDLSFADAVPAPFKVGVIIPLTGSTGSVGVLIKKAVDLAAERLSEADRKSIALIVEDDAYIPTRSISSYQRLKMQQGLDAVLVFSSTIGNVMAPIIEQDRIPLIAVGASDINIVSGRHFSFLHWVSPETETTVLAQELARRNYRHIVLLSAEHQGFISIFNALRKALDQEQIRNRVVFDEQTPADETDYRSYLLKARGKGVDALVAGILPEQTAALAKQARNGALKADLVGVEVFGDPDVIKAAEGALSGQWYVTSDPGAKWFLDAYHLRYGEEPGWISANAYDSFMLLVEGGLHHSKRGEALAEWLSQVKDYDGACGKYSATGDHRFALPAAIKVVP